MPIGNLDHGGAIHTHHSVSVVGPQLELASVKWYWNYIILNPSGTRSSRKGAYVLRVPLFSVLKSSVSNR